MKYKIVVADPEKCNGCGICELVCSIVKAKRINPYFSRIKTVRLEPLIITTLACKMCEEPDCIRVCPEEALNRDEETGVITVSDIECNVCGWCIEACEFGAIFIDLKEKTVFTCDGCEGDPKCVALCPKEALSWETYNELGHKKRRGIVQKLCSVKG